MVIIHAKYWKICQMYLRVVGEVGIRQGVLHSGMGIPWAGCLQAVGILEGRQPLRELEAFRWAVH